MILKKISLSPPSRWKGVLGQTDTGKKTNRVTPVIIFNIHYSISIKDCLKPSLLHKDSKSVFKVDIDWWEWGFYKLLTLRMDKQTDRASLIHSKKENGNCYIFNIYHSISTKDSLKPPLHCKPFHCKNCRFPLCPFSHCSFTVFFTIIQFIQWITVIDFGHSPNLQFLQSYDCSFCNLVLTWSDAQNLCF